MTLTERVKRRVSYGAVLLVLIGFVLLDVITARNDGQQSISPVSAELATAEDTKAVVTIASSIPLDDYPVTYEHIDRMVRRALDTDTSERSLTKVIESSDWVIVKINMVMAPVYDYDGKRRHSDWVHYGHERWGDVTDARVVKSVVGYMIDKIRPKRITIVEGAASWAIAGMRKKAKKPHHKQSFNVDGWTVHWKEFGNISYTEMIKEFNKAQRKTKVDYIDLNEDDYRFVPVPGGAFQRTGVKTRAGGEFGYFVRIPGTGKLREGYYMPVTILDADKLVNIPAMKMNAGGGTLIFKNYVGAFSSIPYGDGLSKRQMDNYGYKPGMIDIFSYQPTVYSVVAGFWASEKDWASHTLNLHHNVVIAGGNPVATEATTLRVMGVNPMDVGGIHLANLKGFGSFEEEDIEVIGAQVRDVRRNFIKHSVYDPIGFQNYLMNGPHKASDLDEDLLDGEASLTPKKGDESGGKKWWVFKHPWGFPEAYVSLNECEDITGDLTNTITYAYLCIESPRDQAASFRFGYDDGAKVWLNGEVIYKDDSIHEYKIREQDIPVMVKKGRNHLLIKLKNRYGDAGFASSFEDESGSSLFDMKVVVPEEKDMREKPGV